MSNWCPTSRHVSSLRCRRLAAPPFALNAGSSSQERRSRGGVCNPAKVRSEIRVDLHWGAELNE